MKELAKHGRIGRAAMKAGMDRKTARRYAKAGALPSELTKPRHWRTREDPFAEHWDDVSALLREAPGLEAKTLFEVLLEKHPGRYEAGQLRTLQRRVKVWRGEQGPEREVMLAQAHRPGEAAQTDFTRMGTLSITIAGELYAHLLCVLTLPYSNWRWATVCLSESMAALRRGIQRALFQLGSTPTHHQTDNSTAATHRIPDGKSVVVAENGRRPFNQDYLALMRHFGMKPRTTGIGEKEQNGDVESSNGVIKRALEQALLIRGSRDFESVAAWQELVDDVVKKLNRRCGARLAEEVAAMRPVAVDKLPEWTEEPVRVSEWSTVRIKWCAYSVPSRLIGEWVVARVFEERVEVWYADKLQLSCEKLVGRHQKRIDYRHVIWSLVRKPGAFARYVYREELFPTLNFRRAYDAIAAELRGTKADVEYLRILHLAASTMESEVDAALALLFAEGRPVTADAVKALVVRAKPVEVPELAPQHVDLAFYDTFVAAEGA